VVESGKVALSDDVHAVELSLLERTA
jgi:hypothetical protein